MKGTVFDHSIENKRPEEHERRLDAYRLTESDAQAADVLGIEKQTFYSWRRKHGLASKGKQGQRPKEEGEDNE